MTVDERSRLKLAQALKRALGDDEGITLMELLPPVGWADVATKHDMLQLEVRMDLRFEAIEAHMDSGFAMIESRFGMLDSRFDAIDLRFEMLEGRFEAMDDRFEMVGGRFETLEHKLGERLERELRSQTWKLFTANMALMGAVLGALVAVVKV
jgi:hypothetical protein